jgi:uncharacterized membrane protein
MFEIPNDITKELAARSIGIYKGKLNEIQKAVGVNNRDELLQESKKVLDYIDSKYKDETESEDAVRTKKRLYFSAIFWVTDALALEKKKAFYTAFQKIKPTFFVKDYVAKQ